MIEIVDLEYEETTLTVKDNMSNDEPVYISLKTGDMEYDICIALNEESVEDIIGEMLSILNSRKGN